MITKPFSSFIPQAIRHKINVHIEIGDRCAEHAPILTVDRSPLSIYFHKTLLLLFGLFQPVTSLDLLYVYSAQQDHHTKQHYADKA